MFYYLGIYERSVVNPVVGKSVNIIAEKPHTVFISNSWALINESMSFTQNETYPNVYSVTHNAFDRITSVISVYNKDYPCSLKNVNSLDDCNSYENSYFISGTTIYVHMLDNVTPNKNNIILCYPWNLPALRINESISTSIKVYLENLDIIGGSDSGLKINTPSDNTRHQISCVNCRFMFTQTDAGVKSIHANLKLINCEASYNKYDGISYHNESVGFELNCIGKRNGTEGADSNNGSTGHNSSSILRVNGKYFNNEGPNVADTLSTQSLNIGCIAFDSLNNGTSINKSDFRCGTESTMYLIGCNTKSSNSALNIVEMPIDDGTLYVDSSTKYDTHYGTLTSYTPQFVNESDYIQ